MYDNETAPLSECGVLHTSIQSVSSAYLFMYYACIIHRGPTVAHDTLDCVLYCLPHLFNLHLIQIRNGKDSIESQWGFNKDSVRIQQGFNKDSNRIQQSVSMEIR